MTPKVLGKKLRHFMRDIVKDGDIGVEIRGKYPELMQINLAFVLAGVAFSDKTLKGVSLISKRDEKVMCRLQNTERAIKGMISALERGDILDAIDCAIRVDENVVSYNLHESAGKRGSMKAEDLRKAQGRASDEEIRFAVRTSVENGVRKGVAQKLAANRFGLGLRTVQGITGTKGKRGRPSNS